MKKFTLRSLITLAILIPIAAVAHYAVFPQTTRCILIGFSAFQKTDGIYFSPETDALTQQNVDGYVAEGRIRIESLFGTKSENPVIIYCNSTDEFQKYGAEGNHPAVTQLSIFGEFVVINGTELERDVIAHELCHAELQSEVGWYKRQMQIPTWFDEGLAMQVDDRPWYSEDTLMAALSRGIRLPSLTRMTTPAIFNSGTEDQVWLNYAAAKHQIGNWYSKEKLRHFIRMMNDGAGFDASYK